MLDYSLSPQNNDISLDNVLVRHYYDDMDTIELEPKMPRKPAKPTVAGQRYGSLFAVRKTRKIPGITDWEVKCDCGTVFEVAGHLLTQDRKTFCGCIIVVGLDILLVSD
jgi:hypothetical protein